MPVFPYERATEVMADSLDDLFPERSRLKGPKQISFDLEKFFVSNVENHFLDIIDIRETFDFDVFVCDGALYAEKLVADRLGIPVFAVALAPILPGPRNPPPFFGLRPARTVAGRAVHSVARRMQTSTMKAGVQIYNDLLAANGIDPIAADGFPEEPMARARRVFLNGCPGLEFPGYQPPANAEFVGHLRPVREPNAAAAELPAAVLETGRTVVAVSQGTVDNEDPGKLIVPTLEGLRDSPFLVVAATGGAHTGELRERFAGPNVVIEDHIDFEALFRRAAAFVCSGGWGSILSALHHGVPVVGAGKREGKNDNNARIAHRGLGVDLRTERPKPGQIAAAVGKVLGDASINENVARLRDELDSYDTLAIIDKAIATADPTQ
ncbi:MAG: glycosyltransferase [Acidimicrobiia bacterium]|nr:glycosyltransferase [Acidimicrobiia bacterium]